jgi:NADPH:quinone reductase-like Zn-dependent oxidoreductase
MSDSDVENTMKAIVFYEYGSPDVLDYKDIDKPVPKDDEVLVRVRAASANPYDWHLMRGWPYIGRMLFGLRKPKVSGLGCELAGQVEAVGKNVTRFRPGDEVFGEANGEVPGQPLLELGTFAEYVSVSEDFLELKPNELTFEQAATVPMAGFTALQSLRDDGRIQSGQQVLINGASGGVGTYAVQIAKSFGAEVTAVCSTRNVDLVRSLGADYVVDYTKEDFTRGEQRYDLVLDNVGNHTLAECRRVVKPKGIYLMSFGRPENLWLGPMLYLVQMAMLSPFVSQKLASFSAKRTKEDLLALIELIKAGQLTPVIDRTYPLTEAPEAIRYLEEGRARGKVVITM